MSVLVAARTLGEQSGWSLSPLEYQKVLYIAQMVHLGRTATPLFAEQFEAWDLGPVVPRLYRALKANKSAIVTSVAAPAVFAFGSTQAFAVDDAFSMTQHMTAGQLVAFTHRPGGAWESFYEPGKRGISIPSASILKEWNECMRPSPDALAWAEQMATEVEESPSQYLDSANERALRARLRLDD